MSTQPLERRSAQTTGEGMQEQSVTQKADANPHPPPSIATDSM
jgi:hypothetical protein